jgi:hypothetical protein
MTPGLQFADLVDNEFMNWKKLTHVFLLSLLPQLGHNNLSLGLQFFVLGHPSVSGMDSPNAR